MKKIFAVLCTAFLICACTDDKAQKAAEGFLASYLMMDYDNAVTYCDDAVAKAVTRSSESWQALDTTLLKSIKEAASGTRFEITSVDDESVKDKAQDVFNDAKEGAAAAFATAKEKAQSTVEDIKKEIDDYSDEMDSEDVSKNRLMAVLAYIGPLVIVPLLVAKDSKFAKFHTNQGLILFLLAIVCSLLAKLKVIGWLFSVCGAVVFILAVVGIIYACQGKAKELPVVGNWQILK